MADGDGYGQARPESLASEFNSLDFQIRSQLSKIDTVKVVKVIAVDIDAKTVTVLPLVQQIDGNSQVTSQAQIYGVPYMALRYGVNAVLADPAEGDIGVLLCADRDISTVKETSEESPPGSLRSYDQADGIYLGGVLNTADPTQYVKFTDTGMELADKNGNTLVSSSTGWVFTGPVKFNGAITAESDLKLAGSIKSEAGGTYAGDIHTTGTVFADTDVQAGSGGAKVTMKNHRHSANNTPPTPGF